MSTLSNIENAIGVVETDVVSFFSTTLPALEQKIAADINIIAQDFDNVLQWVGAHGQEIATDVAGLLGIVAAAGIGVPAPVLAAATALNTAVSLVNTAVAAQQQAAATGSTALQQAIAAGSAAYQAVKTAQIATSQAQQQVAQPIATAALAATAS